MKFDFKPGNGWEAALVEAASGAIIPYFKAAKAAMKDITADAYEYAQGLATQRLHTRAKVYLDALEMHGDEGNWTIVLGEGAMFLEEGHPGYDMIAAGLARGPASMASKTVEGRKYVRIPFEQVQAWAKGSHPMNPVVVQQQSVTPTTKGDLAADLRRLKKIFAPDDTGITNDAAGKPVKGSVWSIRKSNEGPQWNYQEFFSDVKKSLEVQPQPSGLLSGITKVQFEGPSGKMRSRYLTWRTATDPRSPMATHTKPNWIHPGFDGVHIMKDVEQYITQQFAQKVDQLFAESGG